MTDLDLAHLLFREFDPRPEDVPWLEGLSCPRVDHRIYNPPRRESKQTIGPLTGALDSIMKLRGVT